MTKISVKHHQIIQLIITLIIISFVYYISTLAFFRLDLTSEKKFTLSEETKDILHDLDKKIFINVYLTGDLPVKFYRLEKSTREMLDEFQAYAGSQIQFKFIDPYDRSGKEARERMFSDLYEKGIDPVNINVRDDQGKTTQKLIFPGLIVNYADKSLAVNLLKNNPGLQGEENLNNSIESLEYEIINAIYQITLDEKQKIAFIEGHGELDQYQVADITRELAKFYQVDRVTINGIANILSPYSAVIIPKPTETYNEKDKYVIDQYLMNGGKLFWLIDPVQVSHDSLGSKGRTMAFPYSMNLEDQLFHYGVRINRTLVQDYQCAIIPVNTAAAGQQSKFAPAPWYYFPLLNPVSNHPILNNLNMIKAEYACAIDTVGNNPQIKNEVLLTSSEFTRLMKTPDMIELREVSQPLSRQAFHDSRQIISVLLEGKFTSVFKNRMINRFTDRPGEFKEQSENAKMIIASDGDLIRNKVLRRPQGIKIEPLGYDRYSNQTFGNKDFIVNAINYLTDKTGLINLRTTSFKIRLLDKAKINSNRFKYQVINLIIPVIIIILIGLMIHFIRKRKYTMP